MTIWLAIGVLCVATTLWLVRPFLARGRVEPNETELAISIYRDQIDELARDARRGLISSVDQDQARREIEGRAARAARRLNAGVSVAKSAPLGATLIALVTTVAALGAYLSLGAPGLPDSPLAERRAEALAQRASAGDARATAELAAQDLEDQPDGFEKYWALARAYSGSGDHAAAAEAYRLAAEASGNRPGVLSAYAEAMTLANGNKVPQAARIIFAQVLDSVPLDPRARYYSALAKAQAQDFEGALEGWYALYVQSAPDAPWSAKVRRDIVNMARFTGRDLGTLLPDASEDERALASSGAPVRASPVERMAALQATLAENPKQYVRAIELADLLAEADDRAAAQELLTKTAEHYRDAPFVLSELSTARRRISSAGGPDDADITAAAALSDTERDEMIAAMVDGLAERLKQDPDDLDGWLMLIRSYATLQQRDAGEAAIARALAYFGASSSAGIEVVRTATDYGLPVPAASAD